MSTLVPAAASSRREFAIISIVNAGHFISHLLQLTLPPLFIAMRADLGVSFTELGVALSAFYLCSGVGQVVSGVLVDRFGPDRLLIGGMMLQSAAIAAIGLAPSYAVIVVLAALAGCGNSVYHPADLSILSKKVATGRLGRAFALHVVAGSLGFAVSPLLMSLLGAAYGWRTALLATGLACLCVAVSFLLARPLLRLEGHATPRGRGLDLRLPDAAATGKVVLLAFLYFLFTAVCVVGIQSFGIAALQEGFSISAALAAFALTAYQGGNIVGVLVGGHMADRTTHHHRVAMLGLALAAVVLLLVGLVTLPPLVVVAAIIVVGAAIGITTPARDVLVRQATPEEARGKVFGMVYSGFDVGGLAAPLIYGALMDDHRTHAVFVVTALPLLLAISTVSYVRPRSPRSGDA